MAEKRNYEVSIWSLQDEFISVLKPSNLEYKGMIENKTFDLNTNENINKYEFSIPLYLYSGEEKIENPIWINTINGNLIANMRKIKVILNKKTDVEAIYEFLIIDVSQRHAKDQLYCDIVCEDMAYHELGKIGYKISLSAEDFINDDYNWFTNDGSVATQPFQTLQYWNNKFLINIDDTDNPDSNVWYYDVQMDWTSYKDAENRSNKKVYEESFVSSWRIDTITQNLIPAQNGILNYREKERPIEVLESNIFNATQKIAETFGVFCKYIYLYDDTYHISGRRIIYYNNFINEAEGYLDITYPYSLSSITRKNEGQDITTKMFVRAVSTDAASDAGLVTIMDSTANKTREDYVLNFDYMRETGAITEEQFQEIANFESQIYTYNTTIEELSAKKNIISEQIPDVKAKLTIAQNAVVEDKKALSNANDLLNNLTIQDGTDDGYITISQNNPAAAIMVKDLNNSNNTYYVNITVPGIVPQSIKLYHTFTIGGQPQLSNEIKFQIEYDEFGNVSRLSNISSAIVNNQYRAYMIYNYRPKLKYEKIIQTWTTRLAKDEGDVERISTELADLEALLDNYENQYSSAIENKDSLLKKFEVMMGPALRESYWQPDDDYQAYGDKYIDDFTFTNDVTSNNSGDSTYTQWLWDTESFDSEQQMTYETGISQTVIPYPCIKLSDKFLTRFANRLDQISFCYYDYSLASGETYDITTIRNYPVNSQCQFGFTSINNVVTPILILTFADSLTESELAMLRQTSHKPQIAILSTEIVGNNIQLTIDPNDTEPVVASDWITTTASSVAVFPRIQFNSLKLFTNEENLNLKLNYNLLKNYEDYYLLTRANGKYYLTIKPQVLLDNWLTTNKIQVYFTLSNANTAIYLDALQVLKENAYPKVSYEITPNVFSPAFLYSLYNNLNRIVNINDTELKLKNVQGYISSITLNLDSPDQDKIKIKNYKNKFDDLFSTIVAQTQAIQKNSYVLGVASKSFNENGELTSSVLQQSMLKADLNYAFDQGHLTIDEENGIWGTSDAGVVAFRGGGIFTATLKDSQGNWIWNTGILPQGINADLITSGQLDTNRIMVYAGDKLRFQLNGDGLFAYKSFFEDLSALNSSTFSAPTIAAVNQKLANGEDIESSQFVKMDSNGLFLVAKPGAMVLNKEKNDYIVLNGNTIPADGLKRVAISWDGLTLRDYENRRVFYADADTGDLTLEGTLYAKNLFIGSQDDVETVTMDDYINSKIETNTIIEDLQDQIDGQIDTWFFAGTPAPTTATTIGRLSSILEDSWGLSSWQENIGYSVEDLSIILRHSADVYYDIDVPYDSTSGTGSATAGQAWRFVASANNGILTYYWSVISDTATTAALEAASHAQETADGKITTYYAAEKSNEVAPNLTIPNLAVGDLWVNTSKNSLLYRYNGSAWLLVSKRISGTKMVIDTDSGNIEILAGQNATLAANGLLTLVGNGGLLVGSGGNINVDSNGSLNIATNGKFTIDSTNFKINNQGAVTVNGAITATSFTLANGVTIPTSDINGLDSTLSSLRTDVDATHAISETVTYGTSTSSTTQPSQWYDSTSSLSLDEGTYLWIKTVTHYTSGDSTSYSISYIGVDGDDGESISNVTEYYLATSASSGVTTSTPGWTTAIQTTDAQKKYLWNYEIITGSKGTTLNTTSPSIISTYVVDGEEGIAGESVASITEYYLASSQNSGITKNSIGWTTTIQTVTVTNKYLWNYEVVTGSRGTVLNTTSPVIIGTYGDTGAVGESIANIIEYYLATSAATGVTTSTPGWTTSIQTTDSQKKYLWNYEVINGSKGTVLNTTTPSIINTYVTDGINGVNGESVASITEYYLASSQNSGITTSTSGWTTTIQTITATDRYLWNYEVVTGSNGATLNTTTPTIIGVYGDTGQTGESIASVTEYYLATSASSGVTTSTSGWTTSIQTTDAQNKYLWNYEVVTGSKGSTLNTTTPSIINTYVTDGINGTNGESVSSITEYYLATAASSGVTISTTGWTTNIQTVTATNKYLWNYEVVTGSKGTTLNTTTPVIIGVYGNTGSPGAQGTSISTIKCLYCRYSSYSSAPTKPSSEITSTSSTPSNGVWTTVIPQYNGYYYWRCEQYSWSNNTMSWSDPYIDWALYNANSNASSALTTAQNLSTTLSPITTNGLSSGTWNGTDYGVILGNTSTSKPMLIGSNSGIHIAASTSSEDGSAVVMDSSGIAVSSRGTIALDGGSISIKGSENGGSIQFTKADGTLLFSLSNDGSVICQTLHVTGDVIVDGTITGTNVTPTGTSITWYGGYDSVSNQNYYFGWTGKELTVGTTYTVNISINAKNITSNTATLTPYFYAPGQSSSPSFGGHSVGSYIAWTWTGSFIFTPTSAQITPIQWGSLAYAKLFYNASSSSQYYTNIAGYYSQANSPQITLEFVPQ